MRLGSHSGRRNRPRRPSSNRAAAASGLELQGPPVRQLGVVEAGAEVVAAALPAVLQPLRPGLAVATEIMRGAK